MPDESKDQLNGTTPSVRESGNRFFGLSSYAMGFVLVGVVLFSLYEDGLRGILKDPTSYAIFLVAILICFGIGYTTNQKKL